MKLFKPVGVSILFFALCLPTVGQPASTRGPRKWFHSKHPEKSNPHYKDGIHRQAHNNHHVGKRKKP